MATEHDLHHSRLVQIAESEDGPWTIKALSDAGFSSTPKGIYKPKGSSFALSVRRTVGSPYDDPPPFVFGSRFVAVYREERWQDDKPPYTVRALFLNRDRMVPVAYFNEVARQSGSGPRVFELTGLATVVDYREGWFYLEGRSS